MQQAKEEPGSCSSTRCWHRQPPPAARVNLKLDTRYSAEPPVIPNALLQRTAQ